MGLGLGTLNIQCLAVPTMAAPLWAYMCGSPVLQPRRIRLRMNYRGLHLLTRLPKYVKFPRVRLASLPRLVVGERASSRLTLFIRRVPC